MSWVHDVLDAAQLQKHFQLLAALKLPANADRWWSSADVDSVLLPHGARVEGFPSEWLERMLETHCGRSSRYELRRSEGSPERRDGETREQETEAPNDDDDDASSNSTAPTRFSIRFVVRQPRTMAELVRMMRYPRAPEDEGGGDEDEANDDDDEFDLALLSTAFTDASAEVVALVTQAHREGRIFAVSAGPPSDSKVTSKGGGAAATGSDDAAFEVGVTEAPEENDFIQWWREGPLRLRTTHLTNRFVAERFMNTLPTAMDEGESLILDLVRNGSHWLNSRLPSATGSSAEPRLAHRYAIRVEVFPRPQDGGLLSVSHAGGGGGSEPLLDKVLVEMGAQREAQRGARVVLKYSARGSGTGPVPSVRRGPDGSGRRESGTYSANVKVSIERMLTESGGDEPTSWEVFSSRTWVMTLVPRWSFVATGGTERSRDDRPGGVRKPRGDRALLAFFRKELAYPAELELPSSPTILLPCFSCRQKRQRQFVADETDNRNHTDGDDAVTLQRSWWANTSPVVVRSAAARLPTVDEVAAAAADVVAAASAPLDGEVPLRRPDTSVSKAPKKRQRYRELRNTHMLFYGLDLQKPYQPHLHFHPPPY